MQLSRRSRLARALLHLCGWSLEGSKPHARRCVVVAAPHTSNWDFVWLILMAAAYDVSINWLGKHTLFAGPAGPVMRWLGGIPVHRATANKLVEQIADAFASAAREDESLMLVIPPEGTRRRVDYWKSGFYHVARLANVPIVLSVLDYGRRSGGFGDEFMPVEIETDMTRIRAFYADSSGKYPDRFGPVRLRD
ncbi:MAG: lysophospholipid acyltransferase family protein [Pseudomonadales bacterium]|nr:lysophospholipid acyltransferase family protein [Pseudomonadales bacterium]MCP5182510.1 lysophospholipid acyltransferase family protein [Pseudomonadales bacterium]